MSNSKLSFLISDIPASALSRIRRGFAVASGMSPDMRKRFVEEILKKVGKGDNAIDIGSIAKGVNLPEREAAGLATAVITIVGMLSECKEFVDEFLEAAKGKLFDERDRDSALLIANLVGSQRTFLEISWTAAVLRVRHCRP